jgi:hypothetical protein
MTFSNYTKLFTLSHYLISSSLALTLNKVNLQKFFKALMKFNYSTFTLLLFLPYLLNAQIDSAKYRSPVDIPLLLSGNFGELRNNHFHAGLDIKTEGVEGKKIYAIADGFVSRIKVSPWGYGKVLYITHPEDGIVSVYAHLQTFKDSIANYVRKAHYKEELFEIELFPYPEDLPVKKGQVIGLSGNTGGSGGPHLHFEIRDEKSEDPMNPLKFGYKIPDNIKPLIQELIIYPLDTYSKVNLSGSSKKIAVIGVNGNYKLAQPVVLSGKIGFGIKTYDQHSGSHNQLGVYSIELKVNGQRKYFHEMDRFSFDHSRCLNSHVDFVQWKKHKNWFHRCYVAPGNKLSIYKELSNRGVVNFQNDSMHIIEFIVKDFDGNTSVLKFDAKSTMPDLKISQTKISSKSLGKFDHKQEHIYRTDNFSINFPEGSFYEEIDFEFSIGDTAKGAITPTYYVHNDLTPVHGTYSLSIKIDSLPVNNRRKALIVHMDGSGKITPIGGDLRNEWLNANPKVLGNFTVMLDTTPPTLIPLNISEGKNMTLIKTVKFKVGDDLSGVKSYRLLVNGKWELMEYEPKQSLLFHDFDKNLEPGNHQLVLEVKDARGNTNTYIANFIR